MSACGGMVLVCGDRSQHSGDGVRLSGSADHDGLSHTRTRLPNQPGRRASLTFPSVSGIPHTLI